MLKTSNLGPLLIILTVLLFGVGGYVLKEGHWPGFSWNFRPPLISPILEAEAEAGKVTPGFPIELVNIAGDAEIKQSARYRFEDKNGSFTLLRTIYGTKAPIADLFAGYIGYFNDNGYMLKEARSYSGSANIVANRSDQTFTVSIGVSSRSEKEVTVEVRMPRQAR